VTMITYGNGSQSKVIGKGLVEILGFSGSQGQLTQHQSVL